MARPAEDDITWIFGSSRSGSTWLLRMLAEHPGVHPFNETGIGHHLGLWRPIALAWATADEIPPLHTFMDVKRENPDYLFSDAHRDRWHPLLREFLLERLGLQAEPERRVVVQEPGGSHMAEMILGLTPGARLVFLLRDGRDVVDSWLDAYSESGWVTEDGGYPLGEHGRIPFIRWQAAVWRYRTEAVERAFAEQPADRRLLVRYEDLLADTEGELARIQAVAGLDVDPAQVRTAVERHAYDNVPPSERGSGHHVRRACPGAWRENLSEAEQRALLGVIGDKVRELGYPG